MSGHSKWANIKHRKNNQDIKRGKIFSKNIRELVTAARIGGSDINYNSRLRLAIDKSLSNNMTRDTINKAIARGIGINNNFNIKNIIYEGYGPGGTAIMLECMSENKNRTVSEIRNIFFNNGGNLGTTGSVSYLFSKKGIISLASGCNEDKVMEIALEAGADDFITYKDGTIDIYTIPELFIVIKNILKNYKIIIYSSKITMIPYTLININIQEKEKKFNNLINMLENLEYTKVVYHNCNNKNY